MHCQWQGLNSTVSSHAGPIVAFDTSIEGRFSAVAVLPIVNNEEVYEEVYSPRRHHVYNIRQIDRDRL